MAVARAEPTAGELARACEAALAAGYRGPQAAACDWFSEPCGVCGTGEALPRACPPATLAGATRARFLVRAIAERPESLDMPAGRVVAGILAKRYPCAGEDP